MKYNEEDFREDTIKGLMKLGHLRKEATIIFDRSGLLEGYRMNPSYYEDPYEKMFWAEEALKWYEVKKELRILSL